MSPRIVIPLIAVLAVVAGVFVYPPNFLPEFARQPFRLGLDLLGGTHLLYQADLSDVAEGDKSSFMNGLKDVVERRVNLFGVSEPVVAVNRSGGEWRLAVELAGVKDINQAIKIIGETPYLEFKEQRPEAESQKMLESLHGQTIDLSVTDPYFTPTALTGRYINKASLGFNSQTGRPEVLLQFNEEGQNLFAAITQKNVGLPLAIYLDGQPISTPVVEQPITDGSAQITGSFTIKEAKELVERLNSGALPVPISLVSQQTVGATLGRDSLVKSLMAGFVGFVLVAAFMIFWYRLSGLLAVVALLVYAILTLSIFKLIPVTLTLAGIAGFVLSVGMAVDANILIFERMKEELKSGRPFGLAVDEGFKRAWTSIRDSNVSSLITAFILYWFGASLVRGFALTLIIGILISMFSAITLTRTFLRVFINTKASGIKFLWKH
ncbi:MAG: protein translocase subunit SecD [Candidatus Sungbacteria bacterium]|uniref:Protein translocase subunit SecD n=1 Tax=Candidatus Sungiibacteriota bacterium TaxID=2750080 RepID=A0A931YDF2_9BACT|nr:protein translocase subunit SecD [Candidatus Sungbacteria bacterium]